MKNSILEQELVIIKNQLITHKYKENEIGLMGGKSGLIIFFIYYYRHTQDRKYLDFALSELEASYNALSNYDFNFTFSSGLSGFAWTVEHINTFGFYKLDTENILGELDSYIIEQLKLLANRKNFDFLHGSIGIGIYFLSKDKINIKIKEAITFLVNELYKNAIFDSNGHVTWANMENGNILPINLGLSHGIPAILVFLGKAIEKKINTKKAEEMINGGIKFLLNNKLSTDLHGCFYHYTTAPNKYSSKSRLAWCYGDLSVGSALLQLSNIDGFEYLKNSAIEIFLHSTKRLSPEENLVKDACLCHGAIGIAYIFYKSYLSYPDPDLLTCSNYWYRVGLKMRKQDENYHFILDPRTEVPEINYGYLEGTAGVGLGLLGRLSKNQSWDSSLLLS
ncbi:lanthionine synthetase C family protein [Echinicola marina]|uniref:lanthionine synthetase C family protein n=1 Tax=Echinicola marina TaxID=2859768 RepID=UPI001CF6AA0F|nr:lanthionine synthetase C family protein [Echinicola marina]UCS92399.1 lanthionine synthetase C family protein [Echinicola marina]